MSYAVFDDGWYDHPSFLTLSLEALGLWSVGTTYCSKHLTDGKIPPELVRRWGRRGTVAATELVEKGRWRRLQDGGYEHVGYLDHNPSKEEILARKEAQRLSKSEAGKKGGLSSGRSRGQAAASPPASSSPPKRVEAPAEAPVEAQSNPLQSSPIQSSPTLPPSPPLGGVRLVEIPQGVSRNDDGVPPEAEEPEPEENPIDREAEYKRAYEAGIAKGKGSAYMMPRGQQGDLNESLPAFARGGKSGKALRGDRLLEWIAIFAEDFAKFVTDRAKQEPRVVTWYSGYGPRGFVKWLNEGALLDEARDVG